MTGPLEVPSLFVMMDIVRRFLSYYEVNKSIKLTLAIVLPALMASYLGYFQQGIALASGAFLVGITDAPGLMRHKFMGNGMAAVLILLVFLLMGHLSDVYGPSLAALALLFLSFLLAMISVYGARANGIAFSGLISMVLSLHNFGELGRVEQAFLLFLGGVGYLILSLIAYRVRPYFQIMDGLAMGIKSTADYFLLRSRIYEQGTQFKNLQQSLLSKELEIHQSHEILRDLLLKKRAALSGKSSLSRSLVLFFTECVDLVSLAIATTFNIETLSEEEKSSSILQSYRLWLRAVSKELELIESSIRAGKYASPPQHMRLAGSKFLSLKKRRALAQDPADQESLESNALTAVIETMATFVEKISAKIEMLVSLTQLQAENSVEQIKSLQLAKFQSRENYSWDRMIDNLSISSNFFRYALRLSFAVFTAYCFTVLTAVQNPYWVLLTIVVILRPAYGLTKSRMRQRILGTLLGGVLAIFVLSLYLPQWILIILLTVSVFLSFVYNARDYKIGVLFTTLFVVFLYALIEPNFYAVVQLRVIDTIIGVCFAWLFNAYFFAAKELPQLPNLFSKSLRANQTLLIHLIGILRKGRAVQGISKEDELGYKILRKEASIAQANVNAAIQRYLGEPDIQSTEKSHWQELISINHAYFMGLLGLHSLMDGKAERLTINCSDREMLNQLEVQVSGRKTEVDIGQRNEAFSMNFNPEVVTELGQVLHWLKSLNSKLRASVEKYHQLGLLPNFFSENG
jgi:uncharacterized membrane protein YccC